jgi:hypothetical protein
VHREQNTREQFPGAVLDEVEGADRALGRQRDAGGERRREAQPQQRQAQARGQPEQPDQQQRQQDVELLLDRERPGVQRGEGFLMRVAA